MISYLEQISVSTNEKRRQFIMDSMSSIEYESMEMTLNWLTDLN